MQATLSHPVETRDLIRRIKAAHVAVGLSILAGGPWMLYFLFTGQVQSLIYTFASLSPYFLIVVLFMRGHHYIARLLWLFVATMVNFVVTLLGGNETSPEIYFFALLAFPFLVFSWEHERRTMLVVGAFMTVISAVGLAADYFALNEMILPNFSVTSAASEQTNAQTDFFIRLTVAVILLAELGYFAYLTRQSNLEAAEALVQAQAASRAKGEFLANMSHEIRTPMNGLIGMLEVLESMGVDERQAPTVGTIRNSAFSLLRIIDDILDASKIEAGKLDVELRDTELVPVVEGVALTLRPLADETGVKLRLFIDPDVPEWIKSDAGRLRQVLLNLLSNAVKFSSRRLTNRPGEVRLHVAKSGDDSVLLHLRDNGIGMDDDLKTRLFQPFSQGDASTKMHVSGTGLGLVITKNLVELLGGEISVDSQSNQGTEVKVYLPAGGGNGPGNLADVSGLDVAVFSLSDINIEDGLRHMLELSAANIHVIESVDRLAHVKFNNPPVILLPTKDKLLGDEVQRTVERLLPGSRFLRFTPDRSQQLGHQPPNVYTIAIYPLMLSEMLEAIALLADRVAPKIARQPDTPKPEPIAQRDTRILVVEDNEINQIVMGKQLDILGFPHEIAPNGEEGLKLWRSGNYDLVLTDCHMPKLDGFGLTAEIRAIEAAEALQPSPIIAITANALDGEAERCIAAGMDGYLAKPVELESLRAKLREFLSS